MSDYQNPDPFSGMSDAELMQMYSNLQGGLFGADPAKRLNYLQDLEQSLGFNMAQLSGTTNPADQIAPYQEPINQTGAMYGNDQFFASIFQAIEDGNDPISAVRAARDQLGMPAGMTQDEFNQTVLPIATQYASEKVKAQQDRATWEQENAATMGGWTMPDGSKAKQAPLGGNDINATASEYDLMGRPDVNQLFDQYQQMLGVTKPPATTGLNDVVPNLGANIQSVAGGVRDLARRNFQGPASTPVENTLPMASPSAPGMTPATMTQYGMESMPQAPARPSQAITGAASDVRGMNNSAIDAVTAAVTQAAKPPERTGFFQKTDKLAKDSINRRVNDSKNNRIRSDANRNAMNRIIALAGLLQGGFPQK
jgi:hypothetical protein